MGASIFTEQALPSTLYILLELHLFVRRFNGLLHSFDVPQFDLGVSFHLHLFLAAAEKTMDQGLDVSLKIWQDINLSSLQKSLDDDSARLLQHQQDSVAAKKKLAEQTKQFRKLESPEQKLAEFRNLLKGSCKIYICV